MTLITWYARPSDRVGCFAVVGALGIPWDHAVLGPCNAGLRKRGLAARRSSLDRSAGVAALERARSNLVCVARCHLGLARIDRGWHLLGRISASCSQYNPIDTLPRRRCVDVVGLTPSTTHVALGCACHWDPRTALGATSGGGLPRHPFVFVLDCAHLLQRRPRALRRRRHHLGIFVAARAALQRPGRERLVADHRRPPETRPPNCPSKLWRTRAAAYSHRARMFRSSRSS